MRMLLVKLSSLGDVVHALPAVTDALRAHPELELHWAVEEAYSPIPALHPGVARVIPIALRRWRGHWRGAAAEIAACVAALRGSTYDLVLDSQGLIKSSVVAGVCRGPRVGFDRDSAREPAAALAYRCGISVPRRRHAIDRQRALFAAALRYPVPDALDYGLAKSAPGTGLVLAHGTSWDNKRWPQTFWIALARRALSAGMSVTLPWGSAEERARAEAIARHAPGCSVAQQLDLRELVNLLGRSAAVVGVDSGISHLASALGVPTVALYGPTDSALTGCRGDASVNLQAAFGCSPCRARRCAYVGAPEERDGERVEPACFSSLTPERVWQRTRELAGLE